MDDPTVTSALAAAAKRGVNVTITMTDDAQWHSAFTQLTQAGAHVRTYPDTDGALYIHAKAIVADAGQSDQQLLVGSQNFSAASLLHNRELGILTTDKTLITSVSSTIAADYSGAKPYASTASSIAKSSAAQCTATATVYNAAKNENDVTVHSSQPDTEATASAAGHTATYKTNSSGTAVIYLNGPPRGSKIIVTIGGATCTTSD